MQSWARFGPRLPDMTLRSGRTVALATLKERAAARGIDLILVGVALAFSTVLMGYLALGPLLTGNESEIPGLLRLPLITAFVALSLLALYETWVSSATGRTRGKRLRGIQVVRIRDGRRPGIAASFGRAALPVAASLCGLVLVWSAIPLVAPLVALVLYNLVYFSACWDRHGRAWHDKVTQTVVIKTPSS